VKVLALLPYPLDTAPGQRYRIEQWAPYLRDHGIELVFAPFASPGLAARLYRPGGYAAKAVGMLTALARRARDAWSAHGYDAVFVPREASLVGPAWAERLARARRPALIYDFDDAVWLPYVSPSNRYLSYLKFPWKTRAICRMAGAVLAGNAHLADYARRYNRNVHVIPSTVSLRRYRSRPDRVCNGLPVIGWTGSHSSSQYLSLVHGALVRLRRRRPFRFVVIGVSGLAVPGLDVECREWSARTEVEDLWELDVGIMPLSDDRWARGKCGMKAIQYMGVGIPPVASPVGVNREIIQHGENGLLATTEDEWVEALDHLLTDSDLRRRLGRAARRTVEDTYSAEVQAPRVADVFRDVVA
jgi:glycosyltransferase involved in cell wall biosynthesis